MPINPNIILGIKQQTPVDPLESYGKSLTLKNLMAQGDLQDLQMQTAREGMESNQRLKSLFASNPNATPDQVMAIDPKTGMKMRSDRLADADTQSKIDERKIKVLNESMKLHRDQLANVNDPQSAAQWIAAGYNDPVLGSITRRAGSLEEVIARIPQNPADFQKWKMQNGLGIEKVMEMTAPKTSMVDTGGAVVPTETNPLATGFNPAPITKTATPDALMTDKRTREEGAANRGVTLRGQNLTEARAGQTYDPERGVIVDTRAATSRPVMAGTEPLGPKEKPLNDSQSKALLFSTRMDEADKIISELGEKQVNTTTPGMMGTGATAGVINAFSSADKQKLAQGKRNFLNAVLRRESGAVIADSEFANGDKQYFPQIGDSKEVIAQKAANRKSAIDGIKAEVPKQYQNKAAETPNAAPAGGTRVDSLSQADPAKYNGQVATGDDGIKYKSDGKRWVRVQ